MTPTAPHPIGLRHPGVFAALAAALLFGASTPLAKLLLDVVNPWLLAGLFYLGSGIGLTVYRRVRRVAPVTLSRREAGGLAAAILSGGIVAPVLLMFGLTAMPASGASLLLNAEGAFTALLAWFAFKENVDRRIALGMIAIVAGALVISWPGEVGFSGGWPAIAVLGACLAWGIDNNLTRMVSLTDATWIAAIKGVIAGTINLVIALLLGVSLPGLSGAVVAMTLGLFAYGVSLILFVHGLRHLGTARTGAYFSVAPFFGALLAVGLGEPITNSLLVAGGLMAIGTGLHLTERHDHLHTHEPLTHDHEHVHDAHHDHDHNPPAEAGTRHRHVHTHEPITHSHPHYPDAHHRHGH
ncbi:MAG: DMT family transporter [Gammaproteobacteria bacterium]|nr:DMT family transporter [Gammaproteobacteria bacterium]